jgi:hypothetical protein
MYDCNNVINYAYDGTYLIGPNEVLLVLVENVSELAFY